MESRIQRWGNSLAVRIPNTIAKELHISQGTQVELRQHDDQIIISPKKKKEKLKDLISKITDANKHVEVKTHRVMGNEIW